MIIVLVPEVDYLYGFSQSFRGISIDDEPAGSFGIGQYFDYLI